MSKYFIAKSTGSVLEVNESVMVGQGKFAKPLIDQYTSRPDHYTPCTKDGKPLKAAKEESKDESKEDAKSKTEAK